MKFVAILVFLVATTVSAAETRFFVNGLTCPFCARGIEKAFERIDGFEVQKVTVVSLKTGEVSVTTKGKTRLPKEIIERELKETDFSLRSTIEEVNKN